MISDKKFPIQASDGVRGIKIPWELAEEAYEEYSKRYGTSQSLERLAERGGFGVEEIVWLLVERIKRIEGSK
jgi:hypothetical protein